MMEIDRFKELVARLEQESFVMGVRLSWWGRRRGRQQDVVNRLAAMAWPVPLVFLTLDGQFAAMRKKFKAVEDARLV